MSEPLLQHILLLVSTFDSNVKDSATPPVWDGPRTEQTEAILKAISTLGARCQRAETDLDTIRRDHPDVSLPSHRTSLDDYVDSVTDTITEASVSTPKRDTVGSSEETENTGNSLPLPGTRSQDNIEHELLALREEVKLLKTQIHDVTRVCTAIAQGDLEQKIEVEAEGEMLTLKLAMNGFLDILTAMISEVSRISLEFGAEGIFGGQVYVGNLQGKWASFIDLINCQAMDITNQNRWIRDVLEHIVSGDFTSLCPTDYGPEMRGETLRLMQAVIDLKRWMSTEALMEQA